MIAARQVLHDNYLIRLGRHGIPFDPASQTAQQQQTAALLFWACQSEILVDVGSLMPVSVVKDLAHPEGDSIPLAAGQPVPIPLNVAPALRQPGQVFTAVLAYSGGYSQWAGTLTGLGSGPGSDYENTNNHLFIGLYQESPAGSGTYIEYNGFTWDGGPNDFKGQTDPPPPFSFGLGNTPPGNYKVGFTFTGSYTVGLSSTLS